jgi:tRNA pseudouridine55 synthase
VASSETRPDRASVEALLPEFTGDIMQQPPAYSAIKIEGERAYDLAREGEEVVLAERPVSIHRLILTETPDTHHAVFEAECGKGTYVRSLARDFGRRLGCYGHVVALRRLAVGPFDETSALPLAALIGAREEGSGTALDRFLLPIGVALGDLPEIAVAANDAARIARGQSVLIRGRDAPVAAPSVHATFGGRSLAVGEIAEGAFHPRRVFSP